MSLHDVYKVPTSLSLGVIILVITVAVSLSLYKTRQSGRSAPEVEVPTYFPVANEDDLTKLQPIFGRRRK
jgi:tellurite resistance protein TerC